MAMNAPANAPSNKPSVSGATTMTWLSAMPKTGAAASSAEKVTGSSSATASGKGKRHHVQPVGEVVYENGEQHQQAHFGARLEAQANGQTVERAVRRSVRQARSNPRRRAPPAGVGRDRVARQFLRRVDGHARTSPGE